MRTILLPARNLSRVVFLDFLWNLRVPQNVLYQFFVSGALFCLFARINGTDEYLQVLVPGLLALITASNAMQGLGSSFSYMRAYGAWRTVRGSPIPTALYLAGLVLSSMLRVFLTVGLILLIAQVFFSYEFHGSLTLTFVYIAFGVAVFGALGLAIANLINTPQAVTSALNILFLLMAFSGNVLFITKVSALKAVSMVSPMSFLAGLLRDNAQGISWHTNVLINISALTAWLVTSFTVAVKLAQRRVEEN